MAIVYIDMKPITEKKDVDRLFDTLEKAKISEEAKKRSKDFEKISKSLTKKEK